MPGLFIRNLKTGAQNQPNIQFSKQVQNGKKYPNITKQNKRDLLLLQRKKKYATCAIADNAMFQQNLRKWP